MKSDLDAVLTANGLDAMMVLGPGSHNPAMVYLTGGGHFDNAILVKKTGAPAILVVNPMERDEAAKTGLITYTFNDFNYPSLIEASSGNFAKAAAKLYQLVLSKAEVHKGTVSVLGKVEASDFLSIFKELGPLAPEIEFVGENKTSILNQVTITKGKDEIERIIRMGKVTTHVVGQVADYLTSRKVIQEVLMDENGQPLTIGKVKGKINLWLAEQGAENPEDTIFSIGHDAGVCHSSGNPTEVISLGKPIVFDIYPCENGGGYFYDFTRTWSLGYATEPVQKLYDQVRQVYDEVCGELAVGKITQDYQDLTCKLFEEMGHPTIRQNKTTDIGYNHSLGHGVGLRVHEAPWFSVLMPQKDILAPGMVFTVEPGLYYPDQNMGVRLEDTFYVDEQGGIHRCVDYPYDLVLPMKG